MNLVNYLCSKLRERINRRNELRHFRNTLESMHQYLSENGVLVLYVVLPKANEIKGLTDFEKERITDWSFDFNKYKEELPQLQKLYGEDVTYDYILSVFDGGIVVQGEKRKILLDFESEHQHIINGRRVTIGQPTQYHNTIYTHGACTWRGTGVEDKETIASYLQAKINEKYPNSYRVVNSAIGRGSTIDDDFEFMKEQSYTPGDIVIVGSHGIVSSIKTQELKKMGFDVMETSSLFNRPHNYGEWFNDSVLHTNKRGNYVIAMSIFNKIENILCISNNTVTSVKERKPPMPDNIDELTKGQKIYGDNPDLLKFVSTLIPYKKGGIRSRNGAIVMNCNPFTLGHRYLIEYASRQVDNLYVFVVQEDRSYFTFDDRIKLVREGTKDIPNITILPSGNFIISATTFPGYFYKDNLKEAKIDCSNDLSVFAQYIAPALNIKVRFAGEEPLDPVTNQYNEGMKDILPKYGMEFIAIPRKKDDDNVGVISASRVRKLYEQGKLQEIKKLVPQTTFNYLERRYQRERSND